MGGAATVVDAVMFLFIPECVSYLQLLRKRKP